MSSMETVAGFLALLFWSPCMADCRSSPSSSEEYSRASTFCSMSSPFFLSSFFFATPTMTVTLLAFCSDFELPLKALSLSCFTSLWMSIM
uniref:Putative secreted protein n=1 Tax=Ixodes ricinus TaxID=34613 RepID=A0A6B0UGH1_IXORI